MSEQSPGFKPPYEIVHGENRDFVLNSVYPDQRLVQSALDQMKEGIPQSWLNAKKPAHLPYTVHNVFFDTDENPTFCIKRKRHFFQRGQTRIKSVLNEFSLVPTIRSIIQSPEGQQIAKSQGFSHYMFVEPLVAMINKQDQSKWVVYPYIHADTDVTSRDPSRHRFNRDTILNVTGMTDNLFRKNNIIPHDLSTIQFMGSFDNDPIPDTLFLLDIEGYERKIPAVSTGS